MPSNCPGTAYLIGHQSHTSSCFYSGSSRDDIVEPSSFGDQFDLTSFHSVDTLSAALDETDLAGTTGGK